jgi:hypothetical protein
MDTVVGMGLVMGGVEMVTEAGGGKGVGMKMNMEMVMGMVMAMAAFQSICCWCGRVCLGFEE